MAFGGKVNHCTRVLHQQAVKQRAVANITLHKVVAGIALQAGEGGRVACVGQLVPLIIGSSLCRNQSKIKLAPIKPQPPVTIIIEKFRGFWKSVE